MVAALRHLLKNLHMTEFEPKAFVPPEKIQQEIASIDELLAPPKSKAEPVLAIDQAPAAPAWPMLRFLLRSVRNVALASLFAYGAVELTTPSQEPDSALSGNEVRSFIPLDVVETTTSAGMRVNAIRTTLLTEDYRNLEVDFLTGAGNIKLPPKAPLIIIVAPFTYGENLASLLPPLGGNAVVVYKSPRFERMMGPSWPNARMLDMAPGMQGVWKSASTNPITKGYGIHQGLHEASYDISTIVRWAGENVGTDSRRVTLVGVGSGALVAAAAAHRLQNLGMPVYALSLIYPPANMSSAVEDSFYSFPSFARSSLATVLSFMYRRLELQDHLPYLQAGKLQLIMPERSFDLATYAASPAAGMSSLSPIVERVDFNWRSIQNRADSLKARDIVLRWLAEIGAING